MFFSSSLFTIFAVSFIPVIAGQATNSSKEFDWTSLQASPNLTWVDCYTARQCAVLEVPLNYSDSTVGCANLAVIKFPSSLPPGSADYRGPLLFNPGGPGGSGVDAIVQGAETFAQIVGNQFDIVSFDPRGVSHSTPAARFINSEAESMILNMGLVVSVNATTPEIEIPKQLAQSALIGQLAHDRDTGILNHLTTDNVARDMLRIVEASGFEKLQYWGISYGSVLGATFAAMFPDRVQRMVIDGVLDMDSYYTNKWSNLIQDADKVLQIFFDSCFAAGPSGCAFYNSSSSQISQNLFSMLDAVHENPIPVFDSTNTSFGLLDYARFKASIVSSITAPFQSFVPLANALQELAQGNASSIFHMSDPTSPVDIELEAEVAIACADAFDIIPSTVDGWSQYFDEAKNISVFMDVLLGRTIRCAGWQNNPDHFAGPIAGNTSVPILIIGNTADPVTPLAGAKKTSEGFPGSVVLTQDSPGHTSLAATSVCTFQHLQAYFANATLPTAGTVCSVDNQLFPTNTTASAPVHARDFRRSHSSAHKRGEREQALYSAVSALGSMNKVVLPFRVAKI